MASSARTPKSETGQSTGAVTSKEIRAASEDVDDLETILMKDIGKLGKSTLKSLDGFRAFILRGNVVDLAIGIVIGAAFTAVVNALVNDIITPLIPVSGNNSLATWYITIPHTYIKNIQIGAFINSVISFLIVAAVLYFFVVRPVNSFMKLYRKEDDKPTTAECPHCYQSISAKATRCPFCTSHIRNNEDHLKQGRVDDPVLELPASLEKLSEKLAENMIKKANSTLEASSTTATSPDTASTGGTESSTSAATAEK